MGFVKKYALSVMMAIVPFAVQAQDVGQDIFDMFAEYVSRGSARDLESIMENSLEIDLMDEVLECSKVQAVHVMEMFFMNNSPKSFTIIHRSGRDPMKYAIGEMDTGDEIFRVTVFVGTVNGRDRIQQLRIEKSE